MTPTLSQMQEFAARGQAAQSAVNAAVAVAPAATKAAQALDVAKALYEHSPDWVVLHREVFGVEGVIRKLFPSAQERRAFEASRQYRDLLALLGELVRVGGQGWG